MRIRRSGETRRRREGGARWRRTEQETNWEPKYTRKGKPNYAESAIGSTTVVSRSLYLKSHLAPPLLAGHTYIDKADMRVPLNPAGSEPLNQNYKF